MSDHTMLKVILHNAGNVNEADDPTFPFKLEVSLRAPSFMNIAFIGLYGATEELIVRGMTKEALDELIDEQRFRKHPRLIRLILTGPDGVLEKLPQE